MKQVKNNQILNKALTNFNRQTLPFIKVITENGLVDASSVGITPNLWELVDGTLVSKTDGFGFFADETGAGFVKYGTTFLMGVADESGNTVFTVGDGLGNNPVINLDFDAEQINILAAAKINLRSDYVSVVDATSDAEIARFENSTFTLATGTDFEADFESYDDDADAAAGGLAAGKFYVTTGAGAAPLNVAGLLVQKQ